MFSAHVLVSSLRAAACAALVVAAALAPVSAAVAHEQARSCEGCPCLEEACEAPSVEASSTDVEAAPPGELASDACDEDHECPPGCTDCACCPATVVAVPTPGAPALGVTAPVVSLAAPRASLLGGLPPDVFRPPRA